MYSSARENKCPQCGHEEAEHFQNPVDLEVICNNWGCLCSRNPYKENDSMNKKDLSDCCLADVKTKCEMEGRICGEGETNYYICMKCKSACDLV